MALNEPKMRSITGKLVANKLTERDDDFSFNVTYQANRSVKDLCKLAATNSKFTASELELSLIHILSITSRLSISSR